MNTSFIDEELLKVGYLQQKVNDSIANGAHVARDKEALIDYTHTYYALMNYQSILWTRLKLMSTQTDTESEEYINYGSLMLAIEMVCDALGREPHESIEVFHENMKNECLYALETLTGEDMTDYQPVDVDDIDFFL